MTSRNAAGREFSWPNSSGSLSRRLAHTRYGVVFQVSGRSFTNPTGPINDLKHARLVRVFRFGTTLGTGDDAIQAFWDDVAYGDGN